MCVHLGVNTLGHMNTMLSSRETGQSLPVHLGFEAIYFCCLFSLLLFLLHDKGFPLTSLGELHSLRPKWRDWREAERFPSPAPRHCV